MRTFLLCSLVAFTATSACAQTKPATPELLRGMAPDDAELDMRRTPVVRAVERARDSVVSVYIARDSQTLAGGIDGQGSGVIIDASGLVITNWHVVALLEQANHSVFVGLHDGRTIPADLLSSSPEHDLALLQLRSDDPVTAITAGDSDSLMVGETVIAIGNPRGMDHSVTVGVLSSTNRSITVRAPDGQVRKYEGLLHTDAAINQGNSGGALLDITGKLVGINNAMALGVENIGYAIPVQTVRKVFQEVLVSSENLANVWLGLRVEDRGGDTVITDVTPFGPAANAGLRSGDVVAHAGDRRITSALDYARATLQARTGERFPIQVRRGADLRRFELLTASRSEWELLRRTGLTVEVVTAKAEPELLRAASTELYTPTRRRRVPLLPAVLRIRNVEPDSPAAELELRSGDVIIAIATRSFFGSGYRPVRTAEQLIDAARDQAGRSMQILLMRDGEGLEGPLPVRRL